VHSCCLQLPEHGHPIQVTESAPPQTIEGCDALRSRRARTSRRGWTGVEHLDRGLSGAKDRRPALDQLVTDARRRRFDVVVRWRLDRLGRNLRHLIRLLEELQALDIAFVSLNEGIDATTPAGRLQMHIVGIVGVTRSV
jgi:DNA invertase Pin-like site-specific DNA recombinase